MIQPALSPEIRQPEAEEAAELARFWHHGWHGAHAHLIPHGLAKYRTPEMFAERMNAVIGDVRVLGPAGGVIGFHIVNEDELNQLYVAEEVRGTGIAKILIDDAERRIRANGFETAWLACAIGNERAAKFYRKCGWHLERVFIYEAPAPSGSYSLDVWRFEKQLAIADKRSDR